MSGRKNGGSGKDWTQRGRSVDQIKRLYSVLMGFAATQCIINAMACARAGEYSNDIGTILTCNVFIFIMLIVPTYLMGEHYLELSYVRGLGPKMPIGILMFDVLSTISIAGAFVVISQAFPLSDVARSHKITILELENFQPIFLNHLIIFYLFDATVMVAGALINAFSGLPAENVKPHKSALVGLTIIDVAMTFIALLLLEIHRDYGGIFSISVIMIMLTTFHGGRFLLEMLIYRTTYLAKIP